MKKLLFVLLLSICAFGDVSSVTKPFTAVAGQPAKASERNAVDDTLYTRLNTVIDTLNRKNTSVETDTAIIDSAKITKLECDTAQIDTATITYQKSNRINIDSIVSFPYIDSATIDSAKITKLEADTAQIDTATITYQKSNRIDAGLRSVADLDIFSADGKSVLTDPGTKQLVQTRGRYGTVQLFKNAKNRFQQPVDPPPGKSGDPQAGSIAQCGE